MIFAIQRTMTESLESPQCVEKTKILNGNVSTLQPEKLGTDYKFKRKIVWVNVVAFIVMHLTALYGIYLIPKANPYSALWGFLTAAMASQGITAGAHRLYAHKAYKAKPALRAFLVFLQTIAGQNSMYTWVRDHRLHHRYSDTDADPHNAKRGFFFSHMGWLMSKKHPLVKEYGKTIDMSDLEADEIVMFQKKYFKSLFTATTIILSIVIPMYFWQETLKNSICICFFARYILSLNATWLVNSWAHFFGTRPYNKKIIPVETKLVSYLTLGEGWHNYHHTFPWDYKASELGAPANITRKIIEMWAYLGLAYDLKTVSDKVIQRTLQKLGDGTVPNYSFLRKLEDNPDLVDCTEDNTDMDVSSKDSSIPAVPNKSMLNACHTRTNHLIPTKSG